MSVLIGDKEYFPGIGKIQFEGPDSDNPSPLNTTMKTVWSLAAP